MPPSARVTSVVNAGLGGWVKAEVLLPVSITAAFLATWLAAESRAHVHMRCSTLLQCIWDVLTKFIINNKFHLNAYHSLNM